MSEKLNITIMMGGPSAEREVSLRSGAEVSKALRSLGHSICEIDPKDPWTLPSETDVVFLALHGTYGEDGTVQDEMEKLGAIYTGCDSEASRIGFNKFLTKQKFVEAEVPTAKFELIESANASWPRGWNPPVVLKPACQGSSVGLQIVERVSDWSAALTEAFRHGSPLLMEEKIVGRECTVGILGEEVLPILEVEPKGVYDYNTKYHSKTTEYFCPARFDDATTKRVQNAAFQAFKAIGGRDYSRVDIIVRESGEPVVLEVNTLPGMTATSSLPKIAEAAGIAYEELCQRMVDLAMRRAVAKSKH
jgi:D-alanine-D-alanine ligase